MFQARYEITGADVEPLYEHVNHARSLAFLERARLEFLERLGFPNDRFLDEKLYFVIASLSALYKREILPGEITVTCDRGWIDGKTVGIAQRILNARGKVAIEARVESKFMDGRTKRAIAPPEQFAKAFLAQLGGPGGE